MCQETSIKELCDLFEVSRSCYYAWETDKESNRKKRNRILSMKIKNLHTESRRIYGSPKITRELNKQGILCGHNRVARLMKKMGVSGVQKKKFRPKTTLSKHELRISPDLVSKIEKLDRPNKVWVSDITYIPTQEGWTYLSGIMDLYSRSIKGWSLKSTLKTCLISEAFLKAVSKNLPEAGLILHSDRGSQYASYEYLELLQKYKVLSSMGRTGNCYDNATMESFWATLKAELNVKVAFRTKEEARLAIFDYIELFYNKRRMHGSIGYISPIDFEKRFEYKNARPFVSCFLG
jgi:transposase InsO family protein